MSDDWKVGDLAVCVYAGPIPHKGKVATGGDLLREGHAYRVSGLNPFPSGVFADHPCLQLAGINHPGFGRERFRKIRPDEPTACEEEFKTLLDLSRKVKTFDEAVEALRRDHAEYRARLEDAFLRSLERRSGEQA